MIDLTIVYYTSNQLPVAIADRIRSHLSEIRVALKIRVISVSHKPIDFGDNLVVNNPEVSVHQLYKQILFGANHAHTKYVACCEDDALYSKSHFTDFRPKDDEFAYDMNKWGIYSWHHPSKFSFKHRPCMWTCIAPRDLLIDTLSERLDSEYATAPERLKFFGEPGRYDKQLRVTKRKIVEFEAAESSIVFSHLYALGADYLGRRKRIGDHATEVHKDWGKASDIMMKYWGEEEWRSQIG